jgi:hypothetical protein
MNCSWPGTPARDGSVTTGTLTGTVGYTGPTPDPDLVDRRGMTPSPERGNRRFGPRRRGASTLVAVRLWSATTIIGRETALAQILDSLVDAERVSKTGNRNRHNSLDESVPS